MFNIALLGGINSIHTIRWVNALSQRGHKIHLITQHTPNIDKPSIKIKVHYLPFQGNLGYFFNALFLRKLLNEMKPALLHAHYASGYGTLGRLCGYRPYILSVWGSDVYDFPYESKLKMRLLQRNLKSADIVLSTSHVMAEQTRNICPSLKEVYVTPFGIDVNMFKPDDSKKRKDVITIGTVKTLNYKYGIDTLIMGFAETRQNLMRIDSGLASRLRLLIVGDGPEKGNLEQLANSLKIADVSRFTGRIPNIKVPEYLHEMDIYVAVSRLDSFGVAVLEASACGLPVIVSNAGGLPEVVEDGVTGYVIPKEDHYALSEVLKKLIINEELRIRLGYAGRQRVIKHYEWEDSVSIMENIYRQLLERFKLK